MPVLNNVLNREYNESKIFVCSKCLGVVTNGIPFANKYIKRLRDNIIITVAGNFFNVYRSSKLTLLGSGIIHESAITCIATNGFYIFSAAEQNIFAWKRCQQLKHTFKGHEKNICLLFPFGQHLISVDELSNLRVWDVKSGELYLDLPFDNEVFHITTLIHPNTYLNKILLGCSQGQLQLWNLKTAVLIYTFNGWDVSVTALEQAPAIDIVAIGLQSGHIHLHNIRVDETLFSFMQDWGPITSLTFRTDGLPVMASASCIGHIAVWNLEERKICSQIMKAHNSLISKIYFLPNEPIIVSSSSDNSLKMWIFDFADGNGRLLRFKDGHSGPPTYIRFYGYSGKFILSAGEDSTLRSFSTVLEVLNRNLGRASYKKKASKHHGLKKDSYKMSSIVGFACGILCLYCLYLHYLPETSRENEWESIVTIHRNSKYALCWSFVNKTLSEKKFCSERFMIDGELKNAKAMCVDISTCGNFVVIGYNSGHIDRFNVQSGAYRGSYGELKAHQKSVIAVKINDVNTMLMSGSVDGVIKFWKFKENAYFSEIQLSSGISNMHLEPQSDLLAVVLDNFSIQIIELIGNNISRTFIGHSGSVTDLAFSPDLRWLISSSMDCTVRVWDVPSNCCIDCFHLLHPCISLTFSPTGEYLATCHSDDVGIYLWHNRLLFEHVSLKSLDENFLSSLKCIHDKEWLENETPALKVESDLNYSTSDQTTSNLITLAMLPHTQWQNILNLDTIKERNKPKQIYKPSKAIPFFLPTISEMNPNMIESENSSKVNITKKKKRNIFALNTLGKILIENDNKKLLNYMKQLGPSNLELQIRSLAPEGGGSVKLLSSFMQFIIKELNSNLNYEALQSWLALFLKIHSNTILSNDEPKLYIKKLQEVQNKKWNQLQSKYQQNLCLISYLQSTVIF